MALKPAKFKLEEMVLVAGQPFQVAGLVQFEGPDAAVATRYLLSGEKGTSQILEERGERFAVLRQFPSTAAPEPSGNEISVMGARYALAGVDKLKVINAEGGAVGAAPSQGLLLSGRFNGDSGSLLREITPGASKVQTFYAVKPVSPEELLTAADYAKIQLAEREIAEQAAAAQAERGEASSGSSWVKKAVSWGIAILVIGVLVYACSGSDEDSSGSARSGSVHYSGGHGGK
jgi:hypothetical protein